MQLAIIPLCILSCYTVFAVPIETDSRRPIWNIAHMVNALYQVDHYLDRGANAIEFDIAFSFEGTAEYTFHGIPCDCFRVCTKYEDFVTYLKYLRRLTTPGDPIFRKELVMLFMDFKVKGLSRSSLINAGEDMAQKLLDYYWIRGESQVEPYIVISLPSVKHVEVMTSLLNTLQSRNASEYISRIGVDFSGNENIEVIEDCLESSGLDDRSWLGDGITNCFGRSTKRLRSAMDKRDEHDADFSKVYWWTVDRKSTMRRVIRLGVDAMITNYPHNLAKVLNEDAFNQYVRLATVEDNPWKKYVQKTERSSAFREGNSTFYDESEVDEILYN